MHAGVIAVGVDLVDVERFGRALERTPGLAHRVFTEQELGECAGRVASIAGRWAIKEAVAKALVDNRGHEWHDCITSRGDHGEPHVQLHGSLLDSAEARGIGAWHVSVSHDGGMAIAFVVASGDTHALGQR